jgi:hypothetical protein
MAVHNPDSTNAPEVQVQGPRRLYTSGDVVPEAGIYRVFHAEHRVSHEVTLNRGHKFPVCAKCSTAVVFELLRGAPEASIQRNFNVTLYQLPVFEEEGEEEKPTQKFKAAS